jgi:hypothetical protein
MQWRIRLRNERCIPRKKIHNRFEQNVLCHQVYQFILHCTQKPQTFRHRGQEKIFHDDVIIFVVIYIIIVDSSSLMTRNRRPFLRQVPMWWEKIFHVVICCNIIIVDSSSLMTRNRRPFLHRCWPEIGDPFFVRFRCGSDVMGRECGGVWKKISGTFTLFLWLWRPKRLSRLICFLSNSICPYS